MDIGRIVCLRCDREIDVQETEAVFVDIGNGRQVAFCSPGCAEAWRVR